jgi:hypothetical protein
MALSQAARLMAPLDDLTFHNRLDQGFRMGKAPRRVLRPPSGSHERSNPHYAAVATRPVLDGRMTFLADLPPPLRPAPPSGEPIASMVSGDTPAPTSDSTAPALTGSSAIAEAPEISPTVPANVVLGVRGARMDTFDPPNTGIRVHSAPSAMHYKTPQGMMRRGRQWERSETDPYTGRRVDYYREDLAAVTTPNKDYRMPREQLHHVNPRLVMLQGYDHTMPKAQRREKLAEPYHPDGQYDEAANYMRVQGEVRERVARDVRLNQNGERPAWVRDTQRPVGFVGYQDFSRFVPDMPGTQRADLRAPLGPATREFAQNPVPQNDLKVRGVYRDNASRPHVEKVDWRAPSGAPDGQSAATRFGQEHEPRAMRDEYTAEGGKLDQGPAGASAGQAAAAPRFGLHSEPTTRKEAIKMDPAFIISRSMHGSSGMADGGPSPPIVSRLHTRAGHKVDGERGAAARGLAAREGGTTAAPDLPRLDTHHPPKRDALPTLAGPTWAPARDGGARGTSNRDVHDQHHEQRRAELPTLAGPTWAPARDGGARGTSNRDVHDQHHEQRRAELPTLAGPTWAPARDGGARGTSNRDVNDQHHEQRRAELPTLVGPTWAPARDGGARGTSNRDVNDQHHEQRRAELPTLAGLTLAPARDGGARGTANRDVNDQHHVPRRDAQPGVVPAGFTPIHRPATAPPKISRVEEHSNTRRETTRVEGTDYVALKAAEGAGDATGVLHQAVYLEGGGQRNAAYQRAAGTAQTGVGRSGNTAGATSNVSRVDEHSVTRREVTRVDGTNYVQVGAKEGTGAAQVHGEQEMLLGHGKRAVTGAMRPAVTYLHGGINEGSRVQGGSLGVSHYFGDNREVDRTELNPVITSYRPQYAGR